MNITIKHTKQFTTLRKDKRRIAVLEGSSRSAKTYSVIQLLISFCLARKVRCTAARLKLTWVKATIFLDFIDILQNHFNLYDPNAMNKTESIYTFQNGSTFRFLGLDETQKLHGYKGDILWINEAMECSKNSFTQLAMRTTGKIYIDYNPSAESHWIYDTVIPRDDCTFIKSTYKDNPFLEQAIIDEIERLKPTAENIKMGTADETLWKIYGLGERAAHKGLIFGGTEICKELPPKEEWKKHAYGMDMGYSNDPTALSLVVLSQGELYFKQLLYEKGLVNRKDPRNPQQKSIEQRLEELEIPKNAEIWADSAEPKTIKDLQNAGYFNLQGADKGKDSIVNGIQNILRYKTYITEDSLDFIKERNNFKWAESKDGKILNKPVDAFNHLWDATRYCCSMKFRMVYEDKYKATSPIDRLKKGKTLEEKLKYYENRRRLESAF